MMCRRRWRPSREKAAAAPCSKANFRLSAESGTRLSAIAAAHDRRQSRFGKTVASAELTVVITGAFHLWWESLFGKKHLLFGKVQERTDEDLLDD